MLAAIVKKRKKTDNMNLFENLPENIKAVIRRLKFIDKLYYNRSIYQGEFNFNAEYDFHPYSHYFATLNYLLITCFDALTEHKFLDFGDWIRMKDNQLRDELLAGNSCIESTPIETTTLLYEKYKEIYGVNKSIKTLIFEDFSEENRMKLFDSFEVAKVTSLKERPANISGGDYDRIEPIESYEKKFKYFLNIRNKFTHEAFIHAGIDDIGYNHIDNYHMSKGEIKQSVANQTKVDSKTKTHKIISLKGWPLILREIIGDYILTKYNYDIRLKKDIIKTYSGQYNFNLLWSKSEKILWAEKSDGKLIYLGGSNFNHYEEAINHIDEVVNDAVNQDRILNMYPNSIVSIPFTRLQRIGSLVNIIGYVTSKKGNKYPIRFRPEFKQFMFFDKQIENWRVQLATTNEISEILEEAKTYIDENFEK